MAIATEVTVGVCTAILTAGLGKLASVSTADARLIGRWEGELSPNGEASAEFPTHVIRWSLVLARPSRSSNCGLLYYRRECTAENRIISQGLDQLLDHTSSCRILPKRCRLEIGRVFHRNADGEIDYSKRVYHVACRFARLGKIYVDTEIINGYRRDRWSGLLRRN